MKYAKGKTAEGNPKYTFEKDGVTVTIDLDRDFSQAGAFTSDEEESIEIEPRVFAIIDSISWRLEK